MKPIKFIGQLYKITTTRDGGGRITIEFGADSLHAMAEIQQLNGQGDINLAFACLPFKENPGELDLDEKLE